MRKSFPEQTVVLFKLLRELGRSRQWVVTHTDAQLAALMGVKERQLQKYLRYIRDQKYVRIERKRVFINAWFNQRFIYLNED